MLNTRAASPPKTRKARTSDMVQASTNFISINTDDDNVISQRVQRLVHFFGVTGQHARIIASLAWEAANG